MTNPIRDFHAHLYYDPEQVDARETDRGRGAAALRGARRAFSFRAVGPHPRGSCQLTVPAEQFGDVAQWLVLNRGPLTIFAHANTGDDLADHTEHVIWFGPSEAARPVDFQLRRWGFGR